MAAGAKDRLDGGSDPKVAQGAPYGMSRSEIRAELRRLAAAGWQLWELHLRFGHPRTWLTNSTDRRSA